MIYLDKKMLNNFNDLMLSELKSSTNNKKYKKSLERILFSELIELIPRLIEIKKYKKDKSFTESRNLRTIFNIESSTITSYEAYFTSVELITLYRIIRLSRNTDELLLNVKKALDDDLELDFFSYAVQLESEGNTLKNEHRELFDIARAMSKTPYVNIIFANGKKEKYLRKWHNKQLSYCHATDSIIKNYLYKADIKKLECIKEDLHSVDKPIIKIEDSKGKQIISFI